jgi:hypothetical protein
VGCGVKDGVSLEALRECFASGDSARSRTERKGFGEGSGVLADLSPRAALRPPLGVWGLCEVVEAADAGREMAAESDFECFCSVFLDMGESSRFFGGDGVTDMAPAKSTFSVAFFDFLGRGLMGLVALPLYALIESPSSVGIACFCSELSSSEESNRLRDAGRVGDAGACLELS